jgi:ferredoxin
MAFPFVTYVTDLILPIRYDVVNMQHGGSEMIRKIIRIDEDLCNGCGICTKACHEGAIELVGGKARLINDEYCDGLGDCLPGCPVGAISIVERESGGYCGKKSSGAHPWPDSQLKTWPIQLDLVNTSASYFDKADILIAADCTAFAYAGMHRDYIKGRVVLIGCPKLDDAGYYQEKLTDIFKNNDIGSITVVRMSVPCCGGIVYAAKNALQKTQKAIPFDVVTIGTDGQILQGK